MYETARLTISVDPVDTYWHDFMSNVRRTSSGDDVAEIQSKLSRSTPATPTAGPKP